MNTWNLIILDYRKHRKYGANFFVILFLTQGFWAVLQYRLAHWVYKMKFPIIKQLLQLICICWQKIIEMTAGISIPSSAKIGHSFYIGHFGGIIVNSNAIIGNNCNISQGVTIGVSGLNEKRGVPVIGNNVYIAANSVIAGKITIEDDVLIGACSLVNTDVKKGCTVLGVPAIIISNKGSKGYI